MKNLKKSYGALSFLAAILVFVAVLLSPSAVTKIYATAVGEGEGILAGEGSILPDEPADARDDINNGLLSITVNNEDGSVSTPIRALLVLTVIAIAPSLLIMLTSYTRIIVVLHFIRTAIGTQSAPPNQVMAGLALFLTFFIMWPTFQQINEDAILPMDNGDISVEQAIEAAQLPLRDFMFGETQEKDLHLFMEIDGQEYPDNMTLDAYYEVPFTTVVPAFIISELRYAFEIGFLIYIPFIVIDMVVASVLMSMGMMMLPPTTISLPFKILLFVLADGWNLVLGNLVKTFQ